MSNLIHFEIISSTDKAGNSSEELVQNFQKMYCVGGVFDPILAFAYRDSNPAPLSFGQELCFSDEYWFINNYLSSHCYNIIETFAADSPSMQAEFRL